jgi:ubiquinone/menaquinone biosynthesis C-methylase UbiE
VNERKGKTESEMDSIIDYYTHRFSEEKRLSQGPNLLELLRTREILNACLPPKPAVILDVGGGTGAYAVWLLTKGYEVHLVDPVPTHVEQALKTFRSLPGNPVFSAAVGSGEKLDRADSSVDAALLMGPLYHLQEKQDRMAALREAHRVLRPGGVLFAVGISRFASLLDGLNSSFIEDPEFVRIIDRDLRDGRHHNPTDNPLYWTTAYFHQPEELLGEVEEAGFEQAVLLGIEGPGWALKEPERQLVDRNVRKSLLDFLRRIEKERALVGASPHIAVTANKPEERKG